MYIGSANPLLGAFVGFTSYGVEQAYDGLNWYQDMLSRANSMMESYIRKSALSGSWQ